MFDQFEGADNSQFFQNVFNGADLVIFTLDTEYKYTFFNKKHSDVMHAIWSVDIQIGVSMFDYIKSSDDREKAKINFDNVLGGESFSCEEEYGDEKINRFYYENKYSPVLSKGQIVIGICVLVHDITTRRKLEIERLKKEARFRQLFEYSGDGVAVTNDKGRFIEVNANFSTLLGYSEEDFNNLAIQDIRAETSLSREIGKKGFETVLREGRVDFENDLKKKDGTVFRAHIIASRIGMESEVSIQCVVRDISARHNQHELLKKFENIFMFSSDLIAVISLDGYFVELNPKWSVLLGYTLQELKSKRFIEFVHPEDLPATQAKIDDYLKGTSKTIHFENRYRKRKGGYVNLEWNSSFDEERGLIYAVARDVTESRKRESFALDSNDFLLEISRKSHLVNMDFDDFVQLVVTKAARLLNVDFCSYWSYDQLKNGIVCNYDSKKRHKDGDFFISEKSHPRYFKAIKNEHIVAVSKVKEDPRTSEFNDVYFKLFGLKSLIDIQILNDANFKGIICFESFLFRSWTIEEQSVISSIGNIVNQALSNANLKKVQHALIEEQEILKKFANSIPARVSIKKPGGKHIFGNTNELLSWGVDQEEYCGATAQEFVLPEQLKLVNSNDWHVNESGETIFSQFRNTAIDKVFEEYKFKLSDELIGSITFDVTEGFDKNQQLIQRESELKDAQKIAKLGHYVLDLEKGEWSSSEALNLIFGIDDSYTRDIDGWLALLHEDFKEAMYDYFLNDVLTEQIKFDKEYRIVKQQSGESIWVHGLGNLDLDEQGNVIRLIGTIQDISIRKRTQEELHTLSLVASHTQEGVLITDETGLIMWANDAFKELTGYSGEEIIGKRPGSFLQGSETSQETRQQIRQGLIARKSIRVELVNYRKDGSRYWNELKIDPILSAEGDIEGFIGIQNDVTPRYKAAQLLAASEDQLRRLINSVPGAVVKYKLKVNGADEVLYVSNGASDIWELNVDEVFDLPRLGEMVYPEDEEQMNSSITHSSETQSLWDHTWRIKTVSGKTKWLNGRGKPFKDENGDIIWDTIVTDVTSIKLAQDELLAGKDKYESLLNTIEGVVWEGDPETLNFIFVSEKSKDIFQFDSREILKPDFWVSRLHPDDREASITQYKLKIQKGLDHTFDYRFKRKDGSYIWIRNIVTLDKHNGEVVAIKGIMIDVTDRKKVQLDLAKSETLFKSFTDQIPALVYLKDENKKYIFANAAKKEIYDIKEDDYQELSVNNLLAGAKSEHFDQLDDWVLTQNSVIEISGWSSKKLDNRLFDEVKFPINLPDGTRLIGGIAIDVTESFKLQESLIAEKNRAENIIKATSVGTWVYDWSTETLDINERWAEIIGYSKSELQPTNLATWENSLHLDDLIIAKQTFEASKFKEKEIIENEVRQKHKDGHWVWIRSIGSVLSRDIDGNPLKAAGTHLDITSQKLATLNLEKERAFAQNIIASTEAGTWELDIIDDISTINDRWAEIIGFSKEELTPVTKDKFMSLVQRDDRAIMEKSLSAHLSGESAFYEVEFRQKHKSGHYVWVYTKGSVWERDAQGNPTKMGGTHLDIDKRKVAEIDNIRHQKNIESIIESTRAGTWSIDLKTNSLNINERFATMFGYTKFEFEPFDPAARERAIHKDDIKLYRKSFEDHLEGKLAYYEAEFRVKHKDGHWVWVLDRGRIIDRDENGNALNVYGIHLDVTARKQFQIDLLANIEKYKSLTENTSDVVALFDERFNLQYVSPSVKKVLGYGDNRYLEFNTLKRVHHDDHHILLDIFIEIESGVNEFTREYRIFRADDKLIWMQTRTKVLRDETGKVVSILTSSNDITARKLAENLLLEANEQLKSAVETANLGIWHANPKKKEYDWNEELCAIFDLSQEDFKANHEVWKQFIVAEDIEKTKKGLRSLWEGASVKDLRFRILTNSETLKHILASGYPTMNEEGTLVSYIGILIDISGLVRQEEIAKKALDEKNTLFRELHHRVKNNLQLVSSIIHLESRKMDDPKLKRFVKETNSRLLSMAHIHEQLLKFEEVDEINISTYLGSLVSDLMKGYANTKTKYNIKLSVPPIQMHIDKVLALGLIVNEAISNTMKYAFVNVSEGDIRIELTQKDEQFHLIVSDNGLGMAPDQSITDSLGIQLIFALVQQLEGVCTIDREEGVAYSIRF